MNSRPSERGNIFFYIFLGIVLFAALGYAVSRSSINADAVSDQKAELIATELIAQGNAVSDAITKMRLRGILRSELSFINNVTPLAATRYDNPNCTKPDCKVFDPAGGGLSFPIPPVGASDTATYVYGITGQSDIAGVGSVDVSGGNNDITLLLADVNQTVCRKINNLLHGASMDTDLTGWGGTCCTIPYKGNLTPGPSFWGTAGFSPIKPTKAFCAPMANGVGAGSSWLGGPSVLNGKRYFYFVIVSPSGT